MFAAKYKFTIFLWIRFSTEPQVLLHYIRVFIKQPFGVQFNEFGLIRVCNSVYGALINQCNSTSDPSGKVQSAVTGSMYVFQCWLAYAHDRLSKPQ
jgi:hypothetical protein